MSNDMIRIDGVSNVEQLKEMINASVLEAMSNFPIKTVARAKTPSVEGPFMMVQSYDKSGFCLVKRGRPPEGCEKRQVTNPSKIQLEQDVIYQLNDANEIVSANGRNVKPKMEVVVQPKATKKVEVSQEDIDNTLAELGLI